MNAPCGWTEPVRTVASSGRAGFMPIDGMGYDLPYALSSIVANAIDRAARLKTQECTSQV